MRNILAFAAAFLLSVTGIARAQDVGYGKTPPAGAVNSVQYNNVGVFGGVGPVINSVLSFNGSGALVASTTLPSGLAIGTPASGVLTNATGLPVSTGIAGLGTGVATALGVNVGSAGAFVVNGGALGTPSSGVATNLTGLPLSTGVTGALPAANFEPNLGAAVSTLCSASTTNFVRGDGTCVAPSGGAVSLTAATPNLVFTPSPITGAGTIGFTAPTTDQSAAGTAIVTGYNTETVYVGGGFTYTLAQAGTTGFGSGWGTCLLNVSTSGSATLTTTTSTFKGAGNTSSLTIAPGAWACPTSDGTNYGTATSGSGGGSGTVTSVGMTVPTWLTVGGSPITTAGTLAVTGTSESANQVLASPNGSAGALAPRALVGADISGAMSGALDLSFGSVQGDVIYRASGGWTALGPGTAGQFLATGGASANPSWATPPPASLSWAPGQNLAAATTGIGILTPVSTARTINTVTCRPDTAAGGTATIDIYIAASGTALSAGTKVTTTSCNANGTAATNQTGLASTPVSVPAGDAIGIVASGAGWSSSVGAGSISIGW